MFARIFALLPLALLVSASHLQAREGGCGSTQKEMCCNTYTTSENAAEYIQRGDILAALVGVNGLIGVNCIPIVGNVCSAQSSCCENDKFGGLVGVNCNNIGA